jgi:2-amino-4-hydroxy-6-hydroxymethyldihydropteridine diphosphokinase
VKTRAVLALGSNLGDRQNNLELAIEAIRSFPKTELLAASSFHQTVALTVYGEDQTKPAYLNAVVTVATELTAENLFAHCAEIENQMGRVRKTRWQDRNIDVDVIAFGNQTMQSDHLTIPHPRAHERLFVLRPWQEIDPDAEIVGRGKVSELIERLEK